MSSYNDIDIECPDCGAEYRGTVWVAIHAGQDPELKDLLLGGELNLVSCTECTLVAFQDHFLIYQEPSAELIAYVYPEIQKAHSEELQKMMLYGFQEAQQTLEEKDRVSYEPVLLFGLTSLIEMLKEEESRGEQSQVAEAYCKEHKLETVVLRPSQARRLKTVRVIPYTGAKPPTRDGVLAGIERVLAIDPVLDRYAELKEQIQKNPAWALP